MIKTTDFAFPFKTKNQETEKTTKGRVDVITITTTETNGNQRLEEICNALFEKDPGMLILHVTEPLEGELDMSFLGSKHRLTEIQFAEQGRITHLRGLPMALQKLTCTHNELKELNDLPPSLVELNVSHNHLSTMDFNQTPQLRIFRGSHNRLYSLQHLPASLTELYVNHNQLSEIDLNGLNQLRILHCLYNPHPLILTHFPSQTIDLKMDDGPLNQIQAYDGGGGGDESTATSAKNPSKPSIPYLDALNHYMAFKSNYEERVRRWKEKERGKSTSTKTKTKKSLVHPPCIHCEKNVGMTFLRKKINGHSHYYASCGINPIVKHCTFEIELDPGEYGILRTDLFQSMEVLNQETQQFMQQKMNTLFGNIGKNASAIMIKERLTPFMKHMEQHEKIMNEYRNVHDNDNQQELIERQWTKITEIKSHIHSLMEEFRSEPLNRELLHDAMQIHIEQLEPEINRLRHLMHPIMEMNHTKDRNGNVIQSNMFQLSHHLDKLQYEIRKPMVITYQGKS